MRARLNGSLGRWRTVEEGVEIGRVDGGDLVGQLGEVAQVACSLRHRLLGLLSERVRHPIEQPAPHDRLQTNNNSDDDDDDNAWLSGQSCLLPHCCAGWYTDSNNTRTTSMSACRCVVRAFMRKMLTPWWIKLLKGFE